MTVGVRFGTQLNIVVTEIHVLIINEHIYYFLGESPHKCDYCGKSFTSKENMVNHMHLHTGETFIWFIT